jgi:hypothetical protein
LDAGVWHHVAATVNGTSGQIYWDGEPVTMTDAVIGALETDTTQLTIGENINGWLDDVRIYSRALGAEEVAALVSGSAPPEQDTDGDGVPDASDPDDDNDGMSDTEEAVAGTDALDRDSRFEVESLKLETGSLKLKFSSVTGRLYGVEKRDDLASGAWQVLTNDVPGTGGLMELNDTGVNGKRFYRIKVRLP